MAAAHAAAAGSGELIAQASPAALCWPAHAPQPPFNNLQVEGLVSRSLKELARLRAEEEEQDAQQGTAGKLQVCWAAPA